MTSNKRSFRKFRNPIGCLILLAAFAAAAGCSTAESPAGSGNNMNHVLPSGSSVSGWLVTPSGGTHTSSATLDYIANNGSSGCAQCHGSDLDGGISNVSCFGNPAGCHHGPVPNWTSPSAHGATAKKAPGSSGFASCQICHAANFSGGGAQVPCSSCHVVNAPHPRRPWRSSTGSTHTNTDTANAPVCAQCHYPGSPNNPAGHPASPAPAGTAPGCFNSTLCHAEGGHPAGWVATPPAAQPHGDTAKKDGTVSGQGFPSCQTCHGTNFAGGSVNVSCLNNASCHGAGVASPHAPKPWRGSPYTHTNTVEAGNASVCYTCHAYTGTANPNNPHPPPTPAPANTPPGCFNGTMCHNQPVGHNKPYNDPSHYAVTSTTFPGSCGACHTISGSPVNPPAPNPCRTCHVAGNPVASPPLASCTSCHASPPDNNAPAGAVYANIAGAHAAHIALNSTGSPISCDTCHNGLGPSLQNLNHYNRANAVPTENAARVPPGDVLFNSDYLAQTGTRSFDNVGTSTTYLTCNAVSCHGGQATPNWQTLALVGGGQWQGVNTQCTNCHVSGTTQYNSYNSGEHTFHLRLFGTSANSCKVCHNTATLAVNHFTTLSTTEMEGPASATIGGGTTSVTTYVPATGSCTPSAGGTCHGTRDWKGD